ncbi:MAG: transketolase [Deltaproteobacteria bacterium]|nr:transketolase [Deltaproteobacteria bacterium]
MPEAELVKLAKSLRIDVLTMLEKAGSGHPGGSLSVLDIVLTLYSGEMVYDATEPKMETRDRFVLSKGHAVPALYAVMADKGFFPKEDLSTLREAGSPIQGHPANALLPGIEASTGSLGQGLSVAQGIALAAQLHGSKENPSWRTYCVVGDGEIQEGQIWEVAMSAPHLGANNLVAILDWNKGQIDGLVEDVMPIGPIRQRWEAFGWNVIEVNGHDIADLRRGLDEARACTDKPSFIIADTIKGKGVSYMESNTLGWHGSTPNKEQLATAIKELGGAA